MASTAWYSELVGSTIAHQLGVKEKVQKCFATYIYQDRKLTINLALYPTKVEGQVGRGI